MDERLVEKIEIVVMGDGGWNACVPNGPWATDASPESALLRLLSGLGPSGYRLAKDSHETSLFIREPKGAE